jgi:hypothetical protein
MGWVFGYFESGAGMHYQRVESSFDKPSRSVHPSGPLSTRFPRSFHPLSMRKRVHAVPWSGGGDQKRHSAKDTGIVGDMDLSARYRASAT